MERGRLVGVVLLVSIVFLLSMSFVSASWFSDAWSKITGRVTSGTCTETDGGTNYYTRGTLTASSGSSGTDYCVNDDNLQEYYCAGTTGYVAGKSCYSLGKVCRDGACIIDTSCTPNCQGKVCGSDGCGGSCPPGCQIGYTCSSGQCIVESDYGLSNYAIVHTVLQPSFQVNPTFTGLTGNYNLLYYCNNIGGNWNCQNIDSQASFSAKPSMNLDSYGNVHVVFKARSDSVESTRYCNNVGGSWNCENLNIGFMGIYEGTTLKIDSDNKIHILGTGFTDKKVRHCSRYYNAIGESWNCEVIGNGMVNKMYILNNKVHIFYEEGNAIPYKIYKEGSNTYISYDNPPYNGFLWNSTGNIIYCNNINGNWNCNNIMSLGIFTPSQERQQDLVNSVKKYIHSGHGPVKIGIGPNNKFHISYSEGVKYYDVTTTPVKITWDTRVKYCNNVDGSWNCENIYEGIGSSMTFANWLNMVVDNNNKVHIFFDYRTVKDCNNVWGSWNCESLLRSYRLPLIVGSQIYSNNIIHGFDGQYYANNVNNKWGYIIAWPNPGDGRNHGGSQSEINDGSIIIPKQTIVPFPASTACTPNCQGKVCGSDGCGGRCVGSCGSGEICDDGLCITQSVTCTTGQTRSCTATNSCTGTQTCVGGNWGACTTNLQTCVDVEPCPTLQQLIEYGNTWKRREITFAQLIAKARRWRSC